MEKIILWSTKILKKCVGTEPTIINVIELKTEFQTLKTFIRKKEIIHHEKKSKDLSYVEFKAQRKSYDQLQKKKVLLNLQNHQAELLNQKAYQFNNLSVKFQSEKLCCLNIAKMIKLAASISPSTSEVEKSLSLMNLIFTKLTNLTHCMRIRNYLELLI